MAQLTTHVTYHGGIPVLAPNRQHDIDVLLEEVRTKKPLQTTVLKFTHSDLVYNWYWGIVTIVADGLGIHKDDLHAQLKLKVGLIQTWILSEAGRPVPILKSIKRGEIRPGPLLEYVHLAVDVIFSRYISREAMPDIFRRVEERCGPRPW